MHDETTLTELKKKNLLTRTFFLCHVCKAVFKYKKARDQHEQKKHSYSRCDDSEVEEMENENESDYTLMYTKGLLTLNLLIRNINDSIKEGIYNI